MSTERLKWDHHRLSLGLHTVPLGLDIAVHKRMNLWGETAFRKHIGKGDTCIDLCSTDKAVWTQILQKEARGLRH